MHTLLNENEKGYTYKNHLFPPLTKSSPILQKRSTSSFASYLPTYLPYTHYLQLPPIPPNRLQIQRIPNIHQRVPFHKHQIRFPALGNHSSISETEALRIQACRRAERLLWREARFVHEEVEFVVH